MPKRDPRTIIDINTDPALQKRKKSERRYKVVIPSVPKYHYEKDTFDVRDYHYTPRSLNDPTIIRESVDLRPYCTEIEQQGTLGSCTGQAIAGAIELLYKKQELSVDVSRLYIYYYERFLINTLHIDSGARIRDGIKATNKWGAPLERLWPYVIHKFKDEPSPQAIEDGLKRKVTRYERIEDFIGCIDALNDGLPVIIGFLVYSSFENTENKKRGIMQYPDTRKEKLLGGHAVLLVGYDKAQQHFIARNSWGPWWGDGGYFYMPFEVIKNRSMSFDFWTINSVSMP